MKNNILRVGESYRTNPLSKVKGGEIVVVEYHNGKIMEYDNVKSSAAYIRTLLKNKEVKLAYVKKTD